MKGKSLGLLRRLRPKVIKVRMTKNELKESMKEVLWWLEHVSLELANLDHEISETREMRSTQIEPLPKKKRT